MNLLVTGGAGFIGSNFVRMALSGTLTGIQQITVLDKLTYAGSLSNLKEVENNENFKFVLGDICDASLVNKLITEHDAVIHFAAESHVDRSISNPTEFVRTNVEGTSVLLSALKFNPNARFVHVSTDEVYGSIAVGSWTEDFPLAPNSPYSASKAASDLLALAFHRTYGYKISVTRCSNNYGPYQFPEKLIPLFITNLIEGKKVPLYGDGTNIREWIHVDDHCRALHKVLFDGTPGDIYNIGSQNESSNLNLARLILRAFSLTDDSIDFVTDRAGHDFRYSLDYSKITRELGFVEEIKLSEGLTETIRWYQENNSWWQEKKH